MSSMQEEKWINIDEVAEYFGVKTATIRDWIKKTKISLHGKLEKHGNSSIQNLILG